MFLKFFKKMIISFFNNEDGFSVFFWVVIFTILNWGYEACPHCRDNVFQFLLINIPYATLYR